MDQYNSLYTGPQIDGAVGAVLSKETSWDEGAAAKLPPGGTAGQALQKTGAANFAADWVTPPFFVRPNLLDNWYFGPGVINQRGRSEYNIARGDYCIDRWKMTSLNSAAAAKITVGANSTTVENTGSGNIRFETVFPEFFPAGEYTLSALVNAVTLPSGASTPFLCCVDPNSNIVTDSKENISGAGLFSATFDLPNLPETSKRTRRVVVVISPGSTVELTAVKLELGQTQTMAHQENEEWVINELPNQTGELLKCQRYYLPLGVGAACGPSRYLSNQIDWPVPIPVIMAVLPNEATPQTIPSIIGTPRVLDKGKTNFSDAETGFEFSVANIQGATVQIRGTKTAHGLFDSYPRLILTGCALSIEP